MVKVTKSSAGALSKIRITNEIDKIAIPASSDIVVLESNMQLYSLPDKGDLLSKTIELIDFERPKGFLHLPLDASHGWTVNADGTISTVEETGLWVTLVGEKLLRKQLPIPEIKGEFERIILSSDGKRGVAEIADEDDPDFLKFSIVKIDIEDQVLVAANDIESLEGFEIEWAAKSSAFSIFNEQNGTLYTWHIDQDQPKLAFSVEEFKELSLIEWSVTPGGEFISFLLEHDDLGFSLFELRPIDKLGTTHKLRLPDGDWELVRWNPEFNLVVGLCDNGDSQSLRLMTFGGSILAELPLGETWSVDGLILSGDKRNIYFHTANFLYIWTLPERVFQ